MPDIIFFLFYSTIYIVLLGLLSCWTNILYKENKKELSFPQRPVQSWPLRVAKLLGMTLLFLAATACIDVELTSYIIFMSPAKGFLLALYVPFLLIMLSTDLEQHIIFDQQLALFSVLGLVQAIFLYGPNYPGHLLAALAGGGFFLLLAILTRGGIGGGDIKLIAVLGLWLGPVLLKIVAIGGIVLAGLFALVAILLHKKGRRDFIPYSPAFIILSIVLYAML